MNGDQTFDPARSAAIRDMLIDNASAPGRVEARGRLFERRGTVFLAFGVAGAIVLGVGAYAIGSQVAASTNATSAGGSAASGNASLWPRNANGQTYGVQGNHPFPPDLFRVQATNGRTGYVYSSQFDSSTGSPQTVEIPVYKSDGITKIGVIRVGG